MTAVSEVNGAIVAQRRPRSSSQGSPPCEYSIATSPPPVPMFKTPNTPTPLTSSTKRPRSFSLPQPKIIAKAQEEVGRTEQNRHMYHSSRRSIISDDIYKESAKSMSVPNKRRATLPARLGMISAHQERAFHTVAPMRSQTHSATTSSSKGQLHAIASRHAPADLHCNLCSGLLDDAVTITACNHRFCRACLFSRLAQRMACPTCKNETDKKGTIHDDAVDNEQKDDVVDNKDNKDSKKDSSMNGCEQKENKCKTQQRHITDQKQSEDDNNNKATGERTSIEVQSLPEVQAVINKLKAQCPRAIAGKCDFKEPVLIPELRKHLLSCCSLSDAQDRLDKEDDEEKNESTDHTKKGFVTTTTTTCAPVGLVEERVEESCSDCAATRADIDVAIQEYEKVTRELSELRSVITAREERQRRQVMDSLASLSTMQCRKGEEKIENEDKKTPETASIEIVDGKEVRWRIKLQRATPLSNIYNVVRQKLDKKEVILCCDGPINMGGTVIKERDTLGSLGMICEHSNAASARHPVSAARLWVEYE